MLMAVQNQLGLVCSPSLFFFFLIDFNLNTDLFDKNNTLQCYSENDFSSLC